MKTEFEKLRNQEWTDMYDEEIHKRLYEGKKSLVNSIKRFVMVQDLEMH